MKRRNAIDIIERFQTRHVLQEEPEMKNFNASTEGAPTQGVPDKNGMPKTSVFETQKSINTQEIQFNGRKNKMSTRNGERFLYLQRGSQHQLIRGTKKSHACTVAAENNAPKGDFSWTTGI